MSAPSNKEAAPPDAVSIALATFNGARYIRQQMDSYLAQTLLPGEIVVTDDCSTDDTVSIVEAFARSSPVPVRLVQNPTRLGYAENFLATIARCRGGIVALSDQDDVWAPDKLEVCHRALRASAAVLTMHSAHVVDSDLHVIGDLRQFGDGRTAVLPPLAIRPIPLMAYGLTLVFRRELLQLIDAASRPHCVSFPEQRMSHDEWIFLLASIFGPVSIIPERLVMYRQHGANIYGQASQNGGTRLDRWRQVSVDAYQRRLRFLNEVAAMLEQHAPLLDGKHGVLASKGAALYRRLAFHLASRIAMYRETRVDRRVAGLMRTALQGGYSSRALGGKSMLRDAVAIALNVGRQLS